MTATSKQQRYGPTAGTVSGWIGLVICAAVLVTFAISSPGVVGSRWIAGASGAAVVIWSMMLRPVIIVRPPVVELRNPFSSWQVPLATIDAVLVRAVTRIESGGRSYDAVAVGRRVRKMARSVAVPGRVNEFGRADAMPAIEPDPVSRRLDASTPEALADLMIEQILNAAADAKRRNDPVGTPVRTWAVVELGLLGAAAIALAVTLLL